jgi:hypothetical protein
MQNGRTGKRAFDRLWSGLAAINLNAVRVFLRKGAKPAVDYVTSTHQLYSGYALPSAWSAKSWCSDLQIARISVQELFPDIDFTRSPELLFPFPRDLSVYPHELMILALVVSHYQPKRVVEFGTAEGRTALNIALHLPPDGEVVTLDFPPIPGKNEVGYFYWEQPQKAKIRQVFSGVDAWDSRLFRASADIVFCDACDQPAGLAAETLQAFTVVKPGGIIFRHDYGSAQGPTLFWNKLSKELPVRHLDGTTLLCLRVATPEIYGKMQEMISSGRFANFQGD